MNGGQILGALLARLEERQAQIAAQAEAARAKIAEVTALLGELDRAAEHLTITRKTLRRALGATLGSACRRCLHG
jgi:chromosome segregation ATPase